MFDEETHGDLKLQRGEATERLPAASTQPAPILGFRLGCTASARLDKSTSHQTCTIIIQHNVSIVPVTHRCLKESRKSPDQGLKQPVWLPLLALNCHFQCLSFGKVPASDS